MKKEEHHKREIPRHLKKENHPKHELVYHKPKKDYSKIVRMALGIVLIALILFTIYFVFANFIFFKRCSTNECFQSQLVKCSRAKYLAEGKTVYEYFISEKYKGECIVRVRFIKGDFSDSDMKKLVGKEMECYIPLGAVIAPESDINNCHGDLKEVLQDVIIKRMNIYIMENLGKIDANLYNVLSANK